jgi:putative transposon-encoded protein
MAKSWVKKTAVKWGKSAGVLLPKELIGEDVYVLTKDDIKVIKELKGVLDD